MAMMNALQSAMGGGAPAPPNPASLGFGKPPGLPGLPPEASGIGAMPTGSSSTTAKAAADAAILALRDAKGYFPALGQLIDGTIDQLKTAAQQQGAPPPPVGSPGGPGAAVTESSPTMDSGAPGEV